MDAAIKAGVSFWPIDARGLVAEAPLGDATQGSQGNAGIYTGDRRPAPPTTCSSIRKTRSTRWPATRAARPSSTLTTSTRGIVQAQQAISDYYIIGYYTTNTAQNGQFRRVKISLNQDKARISTIARATTPTRSSATSTLSTKNANSKTR